jgi:hypothetical protein
MRQIYQADGLPPEYAGMLADLDLQIASGAEDRVTQEVGALTGVPPRSFEQFASQTSWQVGTVAGR